MTLVWGTSVFFLSNVSSTTPEWLQGEFIVIAFLFCCTAFLPTAVFQAAARRGESPRCSAISGSVISAIKR